jgi:uncharacterized membrane protein HdeD (DUF308 family)
MAGSYHPTEHRFGQVPQITGHWGWLLTLGIMMVLLGAAAIWFDVFTTFVTVSLLGVFLSVGGLVVLVHAVWTRHWNGFLPHLLLGILYLVLGILILKNPFISALSLTILLASFFIVSGLFRSIAAMMLHFEHWGWAEASGIITLLLGILIWMQWPMSGLFILGLFVGLDLLMVGWSFVVLALGARNVNKHLRVV